MLKGPERNFNQHGIIFVIFLDFLVVSEILTLFVNILTPDDKYSPSVKASI